LLATASRNYNAQTVVGACPPTPGGYFIMSAFSHWRHFPVLAALLLIGIAVPAEGQVIIGRGGGISVGVPGVGGVSVGIPRYGFARRVIVGPYGLAPRYVDPYAFPAGAYSAARPIGSAVAAQAFPTAGELRAMDDGALLNAVVGLTAQLDADLNRFDTGDTWQRYLRLPEDAVPPPTRGNQVRLGMASLAETLRRFEVVVAKPEFVQISGLPSFAAAHAALAETVRRYGGQSQPSEPAAPLASNGGVAPQPTLDRGDRPRNIAGRILARRNRTPLPTETPATPAAAPATAPAEELPSPAPILTPPQYNANGERSILAD
jgi:hypothetical protein